MAAASAARMGYNHSISSSDEVAEPRYSLFEHHRRSTHNGRDLHHLTLPLQAQQLWMLNEHRTLAGQAILPGTAYIELARAALEECGEPHVFEISELTFLKALYVPDNETVLARVKLEQTVEGYNFFIQSEVRGTDGGAGWQTHSQAKLIMGLPTGNDNKTLDSILSRYQLKPSQSLPPALRTRQETHLKFGPRWQVLRQVEYQADEALAMLALAESFQADLDQFKLHPGLLDIATGFAMDLIQGYAEAIRTITCGFQSPTVAFDIIVR
jgi:hypothetical protein